MALGVQEGTPMTENSILLAPGDLLFLYTDGVTEAFSPSMQAFGEEGLTQTLLRFSGAFSAAPSVQAVDEAVQTFIAGQPLADDVTLLAVCRL
jgi:sigma-B regulation protein RsbU (phosphoserine phosphatase)